MRSTRWGQPSDVSGYIGITTYFQFQHQARTSVSTRPGPPYLKTLSGQFFFQLMGWRKESMRQRRNTVDLQREGRSQQPSGRGNESRQHESLPKIGRAATEQPTISQTDGHIDTAKYDGVPRHRKTDTRPINQISELKQLYLRNRESVLTYSFRTSPMG